MSIVYSLDYSIVIEIVLFYIKIAHSRAVYVQTNALKNFGFPLSKKKKKLNIKKCE